MFNFIKCCFIFNEFNEIICKFYSIMLMWYITFMNLYMWNIHAPLKWILGHKMMSYSRICLTNILFYY